MHPTKPLQRRQYANDVLRIVSLFYLLVHYLLKKKKSVQGLNQQFANDVLRIVSLQFVLFPGTLFIKKKSMQGLNQQFFVASIHLTSGCY